MKRKAEIKRKTNETDIHLSLNIDGTGKRNIVVPNGFLSHMLDLFAKHGLFDLDIVAKGDTFIDEHHVVEDIGIVLGEAFAKALSDKKGISRYGFSVLPKNGKSMKGVFILPMDESLATVAIDFAGRYSYRFDCEFTSPKIGDLSTDLLWHFWDAFAQNAKVNLSIQVQFGKNAHHQAEAIFKATAHAIRMACEIDSRAKNSIPSTKGVLS